MFLEIKKFVPSKEDDRIMPGDLIAEGNSVGENGEVFRAEMFHTGHHILIRFNNDTDRQYTVSLASILRCVIVQEEVEKMTSPQRVEFFKKLDKKMEDLKNENNREDNNTG